MKPPDEYPWPRRRWVGCRPPDMLPASQGVVLVAVRGEFPRFARFTVRPGLHPTQKRSPRSPHHFEHSGFACVQNGRRTTPHRTIPRHPPDPAYAKVTGIYPCLNLV
jgi:hypothetical protein